MKYRYAETNHLREPTLYMYAPYEGPAFLEAYRAARDEAVARWERIADSKAPESGLTEEERERRLRRFELRKPLSEGEGAGPYARLALALARAAPTLQRLNALLKLNDLLSSLALEAFSPADAAAAVEAVRREREAVDALCKEKGLA